MVLDHAFEEEAVELGPLQPGEAVHLFGREHAGHHRAVIHPGHDHAGHVHRVRVRRLLAVRLEPALHHPDLVVCDTWMRRPSFFMSSLSVRVFSSSVMSIACAW